MECVDKFYRGPLDGQEQPEDLSGDEPRWDPEGKAQYVRWADMDTEGVRAWVHVENPAAQDLATSLGVRARGKALTFGELASLVDGARQVGMPEDAPVAALLSWSGKLRSLTVEPM